MKNILITGANRGIGFEFVKQLTAEEHHIIATCREPSTAGELNAWCQKHPQVTVHQLDVTNDESIQALASELAGQPIDWLINNAGISGNSGVTVGNIERDNFLNVFDTNCLSPLKVSELFLPQLNLSTEKLIICVSSRMGSISDNQRGKSYAYRSSKAALNCAMHSFAIDVADLGIQVLLLHPGWVQTNMGGNDAELTTEESVERMLGVIEKNKTNNHADALLSHNGEVIEW